jgi:hypothetical protein
LTSRLQELKGDAKSTASSARSKARS